MRIATSGRPKTGPTGPKGAPGETRAAVAELLAAGWSSAEIADELGIVKSTVSYHARRLGLAADDRFARRYDWAAVQAYYDRGHSIRECARQFGFCAESWHRAVRAGLLTSRPAARPIEMYLVSGRRTNRSHLKLRLLAAGLKEDRCEECGLTEWRGRPLSLALHHVNGDGLDNRLENLALLCPNCHSQTPNFSGKKTAQRRRAAARALRRAGAVSMDQIKLRPLPVIGSAS